MTKTSGILHPLQRHKFRILFTIDPTDINYDDIINAQGKAFLDIDDIIKARSEMFPEAFDILTQQVMNVEFSLKKKTLELRLRYPVTVKEFNLSLDRILNSKSILRIDLLDSNNTMPVQSYTFCKCQCIDHKMKLDYSTGKPVVHKISLEAKEVIR